MSVSFYDLTIPVFVRALTNLKHILKKGEEYALTNNIQASELLEARLVADMYPIAFQVQRATDAAKFAFERVTGTAPRSFADKEVTFADCQGRLDSVIDYLKSADPKAFEAEGIASKEINLKIGGKDTKMPAQKYIFDFVMPNVFFHVTAAYCILRMKGVPVGKMDFLAGPEGVM